ncbi:MAG: bifunctional homocysteine S-methyltransferase/methylenetetrahydrofolate reductase [Chloroflexi bacterium]|nr:bifunctional homocysteine S-methyltransferase/methylenetetrahydrofolate reductase [Chloroflexota bacterium]OJV99903.1 MAG: bifunctional homocysteine S-methyltransferase/methylenetetrahydrofolate reductase [Chloroflexi bacterium 54-19]
MYNPLLERLDKGVMLADGAMGTILFDRGIPYTVCYEELNVTRPELISEIHRSYIQAGAEIIETNTFGANRFRLAKFGLEDKVRLFNLKAAKLAREVRDISGEPVLVAGSVGPLGQTRGPALQPDAMRAAFREQIEALMEGGVDFILLETFYDYQQMVHALSVAKTITDLPVVAQMTFSEEGHTFSGHTPLEAVTMLKARGADVIGLNCHVGPQGSLSVLEQLSAAGPQFPYLSVMPNAGTPERIDGRMFYHASPEYFASYVPQFVEAGAKIVGGCCGTTPAHIAAMRAALDKIRPETATPHHFTVQAVAEMFAPPHSETVENGTALEKTIEKVNRVEPTNLAKTLAAGKFAISVELIPPKGIKPIKMLNAANQMAELGADTVNITDNAMATVRMSSLGCAMLVQQSVGIEAIVHYTTRDRNLMALQSDLLGAHANGIRNILALTGDPPRMGSYPGASGIWDVDAIGLIDILSKLNQGSDLNGTSIGSAANFNIGAAFNPTATDLPLEIERLRRKLAAGAQFIMTQPVFDPALLRDTLAEVGEIKVPVLAGIMLLHNYKHAEYMYHEVPGIVVPDAVLKRMQNAGEKGMQEGLKVAIEVVEQIHSLIQGVYIMPSHNKYEASAELVKLLRS